LSSASRILFGKLRILAVNYQIRPVSHLDAVRNPN